MVQPKIRDSSYSADDSDHDLILALIGEGKNEDVEKPPKRSKFTTSLYSVLDALDRGSDAFIDKKKLKHYPKKLRQVFIPILKLLVISILVLLFYYNYSAARAQYFMSLDESSGQCEQVAKAVTGKFGMDFMGYWTGNTFFNPSRETVLITFNKFTHTESEYIKIMKSYRQILDDIGESSKTRILSDNLLTWISWISIQIDNGEKNILQFSGSTTSVFNRFSRQAVLNKGSHYCKVIPTCSYNELNGIVNIQYSYTSYISETSCTKISSPVNLGYVTESDGDEFNLKMDMRSLITALAVNKGLLAYSHLVDVHTSTSESVSFNDTNTLYGYKLTKKVDSRYAGMAPIVCFENVTAIPISTGIPHILCTIKIAGIYAYPFFTHKGVAGQGSYSKYDPVPCNCSTATRNESYCSTFDLIAGVIFFGTTDSDSDAASESTSVSGASGGLRRMEQLFENGSSELGAREGLHLLSRLETSLGAGPIPGPSPTSVPAGPPPPTPGSTPPSSRPTVKPSTRPSVTPSEQPTTIPSNSPTTLPTIAPSETPSDAPTQLPTTPAPTVEPSNTPSVSPTELPSLSPTSIPTVVPTVLPGTVPVSVSPTTVPSEAPTAVPSQSPTSFPSIPTEAPTLAPSAFPSMRPTLGPSLVPTIAPSVSPSVTPSSKPTMSPSVLPSVAPTAPPSLSPTRIPSSAPSASPASPGSGPAPNPPVPPPGGSPKPTVLPSSPPLQVSSITPSWSPTASPSMSFVPTAVPAPSNPTLTPSPKPSISPSLSPSSAPAASPTSSPMPPPGSPIQGSTRPSLQPTNTGPQSGSRSPSSRPVVGPVPGPVGSPVGGPTVTSPAPPTVGGTGSGPPTAGGSGGTGETSGSSGGNGKTNIGPPSTQSQFQYIMAMIRRSGSAADVEAKAFPGAFRAVTLGNGKYQNINITALSNADRLALANLTDSTLQTEAYSFCDNKCSFITVNFYDPFTRSVNEYFSSVETGACADSFSMSDAAWQSFLDVKNTPSSLVEVYYRCLPFAQQAFITALGATLGLSTFLALIVAVLVLALAVIFGIRGLTKLPEFYDEVTREKVLEEVSSYLLMVRDKRVKRESDMVLVDNIVSTLRKRNSSLRRKSQEMEVNHSGSPYLTTDKKEYGHTNTNCPQEIGKTDEEDHQRDTDDDQDAVKYL